MGIRFFCPQGHRLHVKSFLAGKRGVCPDCGATVEIPMESDARAVSSKKKRAAGQDDRNGAATAVLDQPETEPADLDPPEIDVSLSAPKLPTHNDFALPVSIAPSAERATDNFGAQEAVRPGQPPVIVTSVNGASSSGVSPPHGTAVAAGRGADLPSPPDAADPIAESPMAIWYVMPPAGGRYGPARGDVMRKWVGEGRVTGESLVWREGWTDWRPAAKVFPDLGSKGASTNEIGPIVSESPRRPIRPIRKSSSSQGLAIVITLGVVCLGLFVALLYVLMSSSTVAPTP